MARRPDVDGRQADFFGAPAPTSAAPVRRPAGKPALEQRPGRRSPSGDKGALPGDAADVLAARLSPAELSALVNALPDDALAHLIITAFRQLRRRLLRRGGRGGSRPSALERSAQQLIAELGGQDGDDHEWDPE